MIKIIAPTNRPLPAFHRYWAESQGPLFANTGKLRRYVQHLTLPEAYGADPAPTGARRAWQPRSTSSSTGRRRPRW